MRVRQRLASALLALSTVVQAQAQAPASPSAPTGDPKVGEALFYDRCAMCHMADGGGQGPSLVGVYGRRAGSATGFAYSEALKASGKTWTGPELDGFLANPARAVPGTAMPVLTPDARERADLIAFFASGH